jgi:hypothetical protein
MKYLQGQVWITMDNLNCVQWIGSEWNVTEKGLVQNLGRRDISQNGRFGDTSDEMSGIQQSKFIADYLRISYP